jgi:hypothetical protein
MFDGNSWFPFVVQSWVGDLVKAAGIQGHQALGEVFRVQKSVVV